MSASHNSCTFVGNLVRDPEVRTSQNGKQVMTLTLGVNGRKDAAFPNIVAFDKTAETYGTLLKKGMSILVESRVSTRSYQNENYKNADGKAVTIPVTEFIAERIQMLGSAPKGAEAPAAIDELEETIA